MREYIEENLAVIRKLIKDVSGDVDTRAGERRDVL